MMPPDSYDSARARTCEPLGFCCLYGHAIVTVVISFLNPILQGGGVGLRIRQILDFFYFVQTHFLSESSIKTKPTSPWTPGSETGQRASPPACQLEGAVVAGLASPPHPVFWATGSCPQAARARAARPRRQRHTQTFMALETSGDGGASVSPRHPGLHPRALFSGRAG